jgi:hypothetical protein
MPKGLLAESGALVSGDVFKVTWKFAWACATGARVRLTKIGAKREIRDEKRGRFMVDFLSR